MLVCSSLLFRRLESVPIWLTSFAEVVLTQGKRVEAGLHCTTARIRADTSLTALHRSHSLSHQDFRPVRRQPLPSVALDPALTQLRAGQFQNPASIPVSIYTHQPGTPKSNTMLPQRNTPPEQLSTDHCFTRFWAGQRQAQTWEKKKETAPALGPCHIYD